MKKHYPYHPPFPQSFSALVNLYRPQDAYYCRATIARTHLATTRRYARYAEATTSPVPDGGSATHCVRGRMTVVARTEAKGEYGRQGARWDYVARCVPPIFPSPAATARTSFRHTPTCPWPRQTATVWRNLQQNRQHTRIHYSSFIIVFHLLRQRKGLRNRLKLLRLTVLQQRFEYMVERGPDE